MALPYTISMKATEQTGKTVAPGVEFSRRYRHCLSMRYIASALLILGCAHTPIETHAPERAMYVVTLGNDTTYIEWLTINGRSMDMKVVERIPRVRSIHLTATLHDDGTITSLDRLAYLPNATDTSPVER